MPTMVTSRPPSVWSNGELIGPKLTQIGALMPSRHPAARHGPSLFQRFLRTESAGSSLLILSAAVALIASNVSWAGGLERVWSVSFGVSAMDRSFSLTLREWINDALMAMFFLLV